MLLSFLEIHSFICSFNKLLLNACSMSDTVTVAEDVAVNKTKSLSSGKWEEINSKQATRQVNRMASHSEECHEENQTRGCEGGRSGLSPKLGGQGSCLRRCYLV